MALRKLREECDQAAWRAREILERERQVRLTNVSQALAAEAEALAAAELAYVDEPATSIAGCIEITARAEPEAGEASRVP